MGRYLEGWGDQWRLLSLVSLLSLTPSLVFVLLHMGGIYALKPTGKKKQLTSDPSLHHGCAPEMTALPTFAATLEFPQDQGPHVRSLLTHKKAV